MHEHGNHGHYSSNIGKAFTIGIILNVAFVAAEFIAGEYYNSMGLVADAGHNLSDVGGLAISMAAFYLAKKRQSATFTYGFRKATILASLLNAVILFGAVGFIVFECIEKFRNPAPVGGVAVMITAGIGILINGLTAALFLRDKERDVNIKGAYLHMFADTLVSVGVVVAGAVIYFTGWSILDPIVGLAIALIIVLSSWALLTESVRLALDGIPGNVKHDELLKQLRSNANVSDIHHWHIWPVSTTENAMTAHVVLKNISMQEETKHELREEAAAHGVAHSTFEIESAICRHTDC